MSPKHHTGRLIRGNESINTLSESLIIKYNIHYNEIGIILSYNINNNPFDFYDIIGMVTSCTM